MSRPACAMLLVAAAGLLGGCGSSPEPVYYALAPEAGVPQPGAPRLIEVRRPALAGYLDRERIVSRVADYRLNLVAGERWGEPLAEMVCRVLAEDLSERLPGSAVFTELAEIAAEPDAIIDLDLQRFDEGADGQVTLRAQVGVEAGHGHAETARTFVLRQRPRGSGTPALVATMSALLGELADGVAAMLRDSR